WSQETITLFGPAGPAAVDVIPVEHEHLTVILPQTHLLPGAFYTVFLPGKGRDTASLTFKVSGPVKKVFTPPSYATTPPRAMTLPATSLTDDDEWNPSAQHLGKRWRSGKRLPPSPGPGMGTHQYSVNMGATALRGQVLRLNGQPFEAVTLR